jgi:hypothetical protein
MKSISGTTLLYIGLGLSLIGPSTAREVQAFFPENRSPAITAVSGSSMQTYTFSDNNGWICPTPSLSVGGFGSGGNDWANDFTNYASAGSGISNYGAGVGLTIPFGGQYSKNCNDYAKSLANRARIQSEEVLRNSQLTLLQQCYWLLSNQINLEQDAFTEKGPFSSLQSCKGYLAKPAQGGGNPSITPPDAPPLSIIPKPSPSNLILQNQR